MVHYQVPRSGAFKVPIDILSASKHIDLDNLLPVETKKTVVAKSLIVLEILSLSPLSGQKVVVL